MKSLCTFILALITLAGWGAGVLVAMAGSTALHEIQGAIYSLTGTVAFGFGALLSYAKETT